ncbi:hypothetical protein CK203_078884 [Vitis vinifera]|uniref:Uncharacterized protein n=1 Tax=Vitis vinifera TaxID=29760 RepID=A0A438FC02_VITVI|nr:hypothetical protein CK203_078884 [Vitis vinifera]
MSLEDVIIHIRIEEQNQNRDNVKKVKELSSKANVVEEKPKPKNNRFRKQNSRTKLNASNKEENREVQFKGNLAGTEVITTVISSKEGDEQVFMGDSRSTPMIGKWKVLFKLTSRKVFALSDILHVLDIVGTWCQYLLLEKQE